MSRPDLQLELSVVVQAEPALLERHVRLLCAATLHVVSMAGTAELGVWFCGPPRMRELNLAHRGVDAATDVLSFPIDEGEPLPEGVPRQLGDVIVCGPYVAEQVAGGMSMVPAGPGQEGDSSVTQALARCVVHGVLHLVGFDHEGDEEQARQMFELEQRVLDSMRTVLEGDGQ